MDRAQLLLSRKKSREISDCCNFILNGNISIPEICKGKSVIYYFTGKGVQGFLKDPKEKKYIKVIDLESKESFSQIKERFYNVGKRIHKAGIEKVSYAQDPKTLNALLGDYK